MQHIFSLADRIGFHLFPLASALLCRCWSNAFLTGGGHPSGSDSCGLSCQLRFAWKMINSAHTYPPNPCQVRKCSDLPRSKSWKQLGAWEWRPSQPDRIQAQLRNAAVEVNILRPESAFGSSQRLDEDDHNFLGSMDTPMTSESDSLTALTPHLRTSPKMKITTISQQRTPLHGGTTWWPLG